MIKKALLYKKILLLVLFCGCCLSFWDSFSTLVPTQQKVLDVIHTFLSANHCLQPYQVVFNYSLHYHYGNTYGMDFPKPDICVDLFAEVEANAVATYNETTLKNFVFVSAASNNHFREMLKAISLIQSRDPGRKIVFYDLGLNQTNIAKMQSLKYVKYRKFNSSCFPDHIRKLTYYSWKPLIVLDALRTYKAVLWMDSSVRLDSSNYQSLFSKLQQNGGIALMHNAGHSIFAVTHPNMYKFIPTNTHVLKKVECYQSTMFVVNTKQNCLDFLWWYYLCSLTKECIAPIDRLHCDFQDRGVSTYSVFSNCHRFDMSLINLLLTNKFCFSSNKYTIYQNNFRVARDDVINFEKDVLLMS